MIFPGFFEREKALYSADTGQTFGEVAYPTSMGAIALEPFAVRCAARICRLATRFRRRDARGGACLRLDRHRFHRDGCAACRRQRADRSGLDFALGPRMTLGASYSGQIASNLIHNAVKGRFTWLF